MSRKIRIEQLVHQHLTPHYLQLEDESKNHHVPQGSESHFKLTLVSSTFDDLSRVARHRLVNKLLQDEFNQGLHALSLHLFTPKEWEARNKAVMDSPKCRDGFEK